MRFWRTKGDSNDEIFSRDEDPLPVFDGGYWCRPRNWRGHVAAGGLLAEDAVPNSCLRRPSARRCSGRWPIRLWLLPVCRVVFLGMVILPHIRGNKTWYRSLI